MQETSCGFHHFVPLMWQLVLPINTLTGCLHDSAPPCISYGLWKLYGVTTWCMVFFSEDRVKLIAFCFNLRCGILQNEHSKLLIFHLRLSLKCFVMFFPVKLAASLHSKF